jgi:hypothetical protein
MSDAGRYIDDHSDLDPRAMRPSKILQAVSPELAPGPDRLNAQAGDYLLYYEDGSSKVFPRIPGVETHPVAFVEKAMEWPGERGSGAGPIAAHDFVPADAEWVVIDANGRKAHVRSSNGNRIEKTIFMHALVEGLPVTFSFRSTAYEIGARLGGEADRVRVQIDGEMVRVCGAMFRLSSELDHKGSRTWYAPRFEKVGVFGEKGGPSLEMVRKAKQLRFEFKAEEDRKKKERLAAISAPNVAPVMIGDQRSPGTMTVSSGRHWADPKRSEPPAPPARSADPNDRVDDPNDRVDDPNDRVDDLPW